MRVWLIGSFFKWCAEKTVGGTWNKIKEVNNNFRILISTEPLLSIFVWFLITLVVSALGLLLFGAIFKIYFVVFLIPVASLCYFVYNIFYVAWQSFKRDRRQLFENLKQL
jgi:hypothetical protein